MSPLLPVGRVVQGLSFVLGSKIDVEKSEFQLKRRDRGSPGEFLPV
jgi:hypothetical protein